MESGSEILRVTAAIVSAFQTAADAVEFIKERKEKKKRKKDKELEELLEVKILHKSLVEGGARVRKHREIRNQQYGPSFEAGDDIAIQALKDVVICLQTEIIQPLHVARAVENASLAFTTLHESSVTNCKDATRAFDQLCQRIVASTQYLPQHASNQFGRVDSSNVSIQASLTSVPVSEFIDSYDVPSSPPSSVGSPPLSNEQRAFSPRTFSFPGSIESVQQRTKAPPRSPLAWIANQANDQVNHPPRDDSLVPVVQTAIYHNSTDVHPEGASVYSSQYTASISDKGSTLQPGSDISTSTLRYSQDRPSRIPSTGGASVLSSQYTSSISDRGSTIQPGSDTSTSTPIASTSGTPSHQPQEEAAHSQSRTIRRLQETHEQLQEMHQMMQYSEQKKQETHQIMQYSEQKKEDYGGYFGPDSDTLTIRSRTLPEDPLLRLTLKVAERSKRVSVASEAPEVVPACAGEPHALSPRVDEFSEKLPSPRIVPDYNARLLSLPAGMDNIWAPLTRPAMHNRYHSFCKGAWMIRKAVPEGLEVQVTPALKEPVLHWACKECKFKSRAPHADALPDEVMSNVKYNIRFRWLFLAKSHMSADTSIDVLENYKYGCILCAADGKTTAVHDKLDHLMVHIVSKHKPITLTPDIRQKTKCIVGNVAHHLEDWDIHIPEMAQKTSTAEAFISASKFFSRKKGKR